MSFAAAASENSPGTMMIIAGMAEYNCSQPIHFAACLNFRYVEAAAVITDLRPTDYSHLTGMQISVTNFSGSSVMP